MNRKRHDVARDFPSKFVGLVVIAVTVTLQPACSEGRVDRASFMVPGTLASVGIERRCSSPFLAEYDRTLIVTTENGFQTREAMSGDTGGTIRVDEVKGVFLGAFDWTKDRGWQFIPASERGPLALELDVQ